MLDDPHLLVAVGVVELVMNGTSIELHSQSLEFECNALLKTLYLVPVL